MAPSRRLLLPLLLLSSLLLVLSCEPTLKEGEAPPPAGPAAGSDRITTPPVPCPGCALPPTTFTGRDGQRQPDVVEFVADPAADYLLVVQDDGRPDIATDIWLNGQKVVDWADLRGEVRELRVPLPHVQKANRLSVIVWGRTGGQVTVWVLSQPRRLAIAHQPYLMPDDQAGSDTFVVEIQDEHGNRVSGSDAVVTAILEEENASLAGEKVVRAVDGVAAFTGLIVRGSGVFRLRFVSGSLEPTLSDSIGIAARLTVVDSSVFDLQADSLEQSLGLFRFSAPQSVSLPDSGNVLVITQGGGYLRRVLKADWSGGSVLLTTTEASIEDLGLVGDYSGDFGTLGAPPVSGRPSLVGPTAITLPNVTMPVGACATVTVSNLGLVPQWGPFKTLLSFSPIGRLTGLGAQMPASLQLTGNYSVHFSCPVTGSLSVSIPLAPTLTIPLPPIQLGLVPLIHSIKISYGVTVTVAATGTVDISGGFVDKRSVSAMLSYSRASGFSFTVPGSSTVTPLATTVTVPQIQAAQVTGSIGAGVQWALWGVVGPYFSVGPYVRFRGTNDPIAHQFNLVCEVGLKADAGIKVGVLGLSTGVSVPVFDIPEPPFCQKAFPYAGGGPGLRYSDDFSSLSNWVEKDPDNLGTWTVQNGELFGDYNIGCGSPGCNQTQLLLADALQPGNSNWRMEVQSGLVQAYCCYNGGAMVNLAKFALWVSNNEKEVFDIGYGWQGLQAPATWDSVTVYHQAFPWHPINFAAMAVPSWSPASWRNAAIEKHGDTYTLFIEGIQVYQTTRMFSAPPKIGFHTYGQVRMRNFRLYALP